jgi:hypothetical protein
VFDDRTKDKKVMSDESFAQLQKRAILHINSKCNYPRLIRDESMVSRKRATNEARRLLDSPVASGV